jgi:hypothetical protein
MLKNRFYIRDCHGRIVGNPKGYRTMRGATQRAESWKSPVYKLLWSTYHASSPTNPNLELVYSIKLFD